jgi:protein-tyrosine phosphatase
MEGRDYLSPAKILAATEQVRQEVAEAGIPVEIVAGAENYIFPRMAEWAAEGKLLTLGNKGKHLLVELPLPEIPLYTDKVFFDLLTKGITPVLAHPERYRALAAKPECLLDWARQGVLFQVDLKSLQGQYGPRPRRLAQLILQNDLGHFLGSDAHGVAGDPLAYREAADKVWKIVGEEKFRQLAKGNAQALLAGNYQPGCRKYIFGEFSAEKRWYQDLWQIFSKGRSKHGWHNFHNS